MRTSSRRFEVLMSRFSVCVLLYGDYPALAERCLGSIVRSQGWPRIADLRVGLNEVSSASVDAIVPLLNEAACNTQVYTYVPERNVGKYPLMRRMLHDRGLPLAENVMWFDDDSFVDPRAGGHGVWWHTVANYMEDVGADMLGALYRLKGGLKPAQKSWIERQPWYAGVPLDPAGPQFATGGWWTLKSDVVVRHDYPFVQLHHNGGDWLLGELLRQHDYELASFRKGVRINFDEARGGESRARRRGMTTPGPADAPYDPRIHEFDCRITYRTCFEEQGEG